MDSDRKIAAPLPPAPQQTPHPTVNGPNNEFSQVRHMHGRTSGPTRRSTRGQWTPDEDEILRAAVHRYNGKNWKRIAESFKDRTDVQCLHRWQKVLNPDLIKGPWSKEEDEIIVQMVKKYGPKKWSTIAQHLPGRIGKQCRERWHNHLNPGINKEAWTQEEELVLIHAHQLYGNKWAELTKFLPGRSDNSIKNHWNSSVKKKLDSYKASGLLEQFQDLALISLQSQSLPIEGEDISECSQVGCSQTASDMSNAICQTREDFIVSEESDQGKIQKNSPTPSCSEQYYTSLDDLTFTISGIPCEFTCSSNYLVENFAEVSGSGVQDCVFGAISLPMNSPSDLDANSCLPQNYFFDSVNDTDANVAGQIPKAEEGCSQIISTQIEGDGCFERSSEVLDMERYNDYMSFQSTCQFSETCGTNASQPYSYTASVLEASNCDNISFTPKVSGQNVSTMEDKKLSQINDSSPANTNSCSPCHNPSDAGFTEQIDLLDSSGSIPVNTLVPEMSNDQQITPPRVEQPVLPTPTSSTLCYEPPRFPSLEIPFFSCDLAQSGNDAQQDFSPLGIRQLMMSSASLTPFKLWDSSDDSPNALLKSAAKKYARTPSILKKRHRDLLSPLSPFSERRYDKKTENDVNQGFLCTSRLTKEFSRLDVIFDETVQCMESTTLSNNSMEHPKALVEDKENICPNIRGFREGANHRQEFKAKPPEEDTHTNVLNHMEKEGTSVADSEIKFSENCTSETPRGILVEHNLNDTEFSSPVEVRPNTRLEMSHKAAEAARLNNTSIDSAFAESTFRKAGSFVFQPSFDHMKQINISAVSSSCQQVSAVTNVVVDSLVNEVGAENLNFFGGTPFRRSMESPSAWKSPWYFSSHVSCPRFEPDITIEDIGIFMSPGERSLDAIGLMKQINEQGADTYANAKEVLGSETPESILRQRCSTKINLEGENNDVSNSQLEDHLHRTSNAMTERRVLDFSECGGTPEKSIEKMECIGAACLSSPC